MIIYLGGSTVFPNLNLIRADELEPGMILGKSVVSDSGKILLKPGLYLTEKNIRKLIKWKTLYVNIESPCSACLARHDILATYEKTLELVTAAFEKIRTFQEVPIRECEELVEDYITLMTSVAGVISILYKIKSHNEYTFGHSLNVAIIAGVIGRWLGFKGENLKDIILAGLLHDIGKIFIPVSILDKPAKLTNEEMEVIKTHSGSGFQLINDCDEISEGVKLGILQHHERQDGSGYPQQLKGEDIHIYGNIVALADLYDAMSNKRIYRSQVPPFVVIETILEQMPKKLDPNVCLIFLENIREFMMGSSVLLSDGRKAKIVSLNEFLRKRPVIQFSSGELIDLEKHRSLEIVAILDDVS